ncbi:MAG: hypothetical protein ABIH03_11545, partial [Pseudomonadota bacterium]
MTAPISYTIYYRAAWADAWTAADANLFCDNVKFAVAPGAPSAQLSRDYGWVQADGSAAAVSALDLRGKYVKIVLADDQTVPGADTWYGYCAHQQDSVAGSHASPADPAVTVHSGQTRYQLEGMDFFLRDQMIDRGYAHDTAGALITVAAPMSWNITGRGR